MLRNARNSYCKISKKSQDYRHLQVLNSQDIKSFVVSTLTLTFITALPLLWIKLLFWLPFFDLAVLCACDLAFLSAHAQPG